MSLVYIKRQRVIVDPGFRHCYRCGTTKPLAEFYSSHREPRGGSETRCKPCIAEIQASYRTRNPDKVSIWEKNHAENRKPKHRDYMLKKLYGISQSAYNSLLASQNGCAICGGPPGGVRGKKTYGVDHCHATGKVRGLLCGNCNNGLGRFFDNPEFLRNAAKYIEDHLMSCK